MEKGRRFRNGRREKVFTLSVLSAALWGVCLPAGAAGAPVFTYFGDPGFVAESPDQVAAAKASWETLEYGTFNGYKPGTTSGTANRVPWHLSAVNASTAYALGYFGQGVTLGMMDSGYRATHEAFQTDLVKSVNVPGVYGTSGYGYRSATPSNKFVKGEAFNVRADYTVDDPESSDWSHGTGMLGVISALRDGKSMHGIAFGSEIYSAYTGGSDSQSHGPFHDYVYWYTANKALVDAGAQVINSSWGSYVQTLSRTQYNGLGQNLGAGGNSANAYQVSGRDSASATAMATVLPNETLKDLEYQYFFSKKTYSEGGIQYNPDHPGESFLDAIWDAIKGTTVVNVRSAGNNDWDNPFYRPSYPLFNPWAENQWVAVGGVQMPSAASNYEYTKQYNFNEAGLAKWWTVSTPSSNFSTTSSGSDTSYTNTSSGTSPATPVATAVMGILLSRYPNMNAMQVRELMFTTANNKMTDGVRFLGTGQTGPNGESIAWTAPDGQPDERWGWGIPDLDKGMYGPGQFLSPMAYNMNKAPLDVWSNNISQIGIKAREAEDLAWLAGYKAQGVAFAGDFSPNVLKEDGTLDPQAFMIQGLLNDPYIQAITDGHPELYDKITYEQAMKWRKEWMDERAAYIQYKIDNGLYTASLTKQGPGTLVMTGDNTYEGGTAVKEGSLYGFTESFGSGKVAVDGGRFGVLASYNDNFTLKGNLTSTGSHRANIDVNNGGTYVVVSGNDVKVGALTFNEGSKATVGIMGIEDDKELVRNIYYNGATATGTVTADTLAGFDKAEVPQDYAFLTMNVAASGNVLTGTAGRTTGVTFASYADHRNSRAVANTIEANGGAIFYGLVPFGTKAQARATFDTLGSDMYLNVDNASVVNSLSMARSIKNQALGIGVGGRSATTKLNDGTARLWATAMGNWSTVDYGYADMDVDFYAGLVGAEVDVNDSNTVGVFFGAGSTEFKGHEYGKVDSDDLHVGLYGIYKAADVAKISYGAMYTHQDRDARRTLVVVDQSATNKVSPDADIGQLFVEAAYTKLNSDKYSVEPYFGVNFMRVKTDSYTERVGGLEFHTKSNKQSLQVATLGVRGSIPFTAGNLEMAVTGDISGMHFFGDNTPDAQLFIADSGSTKIKGGKLDNLWGVGLGLETRFNKSTKLNVSYTGAYNGDIKSSGIYANLRISF